MSLISVFFIGIGLSMDAFAVSIAKGMTMKKHEVLRYALILAVFFGMFQALMPLLGWLAGSYFQEIIASFDHWIAFGLLAIIGINMILAIATSIDALAVGISFALLEVDIVLAIVIIGITTFVLSFLAVFIGHFMGGLLEKYAGILGGIILLLIGIKIVIEHTL